MRLKRPTIVLFDMDGTTVRHIHPRLLQLCETFDDIGHRAGRAWARIARPRALPTSGLPLFDHAGKRPRLLVHRAIHRFRRKPVEQIVEPCPGIVGVLEILKRNGVPMGLVSNSLGAGYGHDVLSAFHLSDYYDVTVFRENIGRSKPHPDPLLRALAGLSRPVTEEDVVWYIGDRHKDILAALAAQPHLPCPIIPLAYGLHAAFAVVEHHLGTGHILSSYEDLERSLSRLFSASPAHQHMAPFNHAALAT